MSGSKTLKIVGLLAFVKLALCLHVAGINDLWFDEFWTYDTARMPYAMLVERTADDVHPPLYYLIEKPFARNTDAWLLRLPSAVFMAAALVFLALGCRRMFGDRAALIAAALFALSPLLTRYGAEARQYAPMVFFWSVAFWSLARLFSRAEAAPAAREWPEWAVYGLALMAGLYTQNLFVLLAGGLAFTSLLAISGLRPRAAHRRDLLAWVVVHALVGLAYLPWLTRVFGQMGERAYALSWMPIPTLTALEHLFLVIPFRYYEKSLFYWDAPLIRALLWTNLAGFLLCAYALRRGLGPRGRRFLVLMLGGALLATAGAYLISRYAVSILMPERFGVLLIPAITVFLAASFAQAPRRAVVRIALYSYAGLIAVAMLFFSARILLVPHQIQNEAVLDLVVESQTSDYIPPMYGVFAARTETFAFERYRRLVAPEVPWFGMPHPDRLPDPTPERPVWFIVSESALRASHPAALLTLEILYRSESRTGPIQFATIHAVLLDRIHWDLLFEHLEGSPLLEYGWDSPSEL